MSELAIISVGASTPLGLDARQTALLLRASKGDPRSSPFVGLDGNTLATMHCHRMEDETIGYARYLALAAPALREAIHVARDHELWRSEERTPVVLLLSAPRPFDGDDPRIDTHLLADVAKLANLSLDPRSAMIRLGHAGVGALLARASLFGPDVRVIVGGLDSYHDPKRIEALDADFRINSERSDYGFVPSEAAAFVCVTPHTKRKEPRPPLAVVKLVATAEEPEGDLVTATALTKLLRDERLPSRVPWMIWDLNRDETRRREWSFSMKRNLGRYQLAPTESTLDELHRELGDVGAATGALYLAWVCMAFKYGFAPEPAALIVTSSDGPERAIFYVEGPSS